MNVMTQSAVQAAGITRALAEQSSALTLDDLPPEVRALARQCLLDYIGVTLAGAREPLVEMLLAEMEEQGGHPAATVIGRDERLPVLSAALVNGAASHALDYDDVTMTMPGHPTVAIMPGLLALAEETAASGAAVLTAFVAGYELQCRIGSALAPGHYDVLGFHATATIGSFGAAAACARLLGLDAEKTAVALGIAGTQAAGLKSMFGTMCKPLHAGKASYHGLLAARLANRGFTSRADVLECAQGFASTHSPDFSPERAFRSPPRGFHIFDNLFKFHAACYGVHGPIEAARKVRRSATFQPEQVKAIRLAVDRTTERMCNIKEPRTALEAKFSLRLATAMALAGVETGAIETFSEATATDPRLTGLRDKVSLEFRDWSPTLAEVEVDLADGRRLSGRHDAGVPAEDVAAQSGRVAAKFAALVEPLLGARVGRIEAAVSELEALPDIRGLMRLCST